MPVVLRWLLRLGPTNPITVRLVQNGSRRVRHLYIRSAYLAVLILVLLWSLLSIPGQSGALSYRELAAAGAASFTYVAYLQIALICILAPVFMAGAIAQEANPRTWDILLTTPLGALQIVLGNLLGRLFFILALLFASLPLFALTQYFGGVPGRSIFASYGIAGCAALLVGTIAIALSVSRLAGKRAVFTFYVAVISYLAVTAGVDWYLRSAGLGSGAGGAGVTWMTALNPFLSLHALLDPSGYPRADPPAPGVGESVLAGWCLRRPVTTWCVGSVLLSVVLLLVSTVTARTGGLSALASVGRSGVPWYRRLLGLGGAGAEHRPPRAVWNNPIAWREAAARNSTLGRILARWAFIGAGALFGIVLLALFHAGSIPPTQFQIALLATVWGELAVTTLVAINMSATAISREREDGTLDLLTITPITSGQYLSGKLRGLIAYLLPMLAVPVGTLALAGVYVLTEGLGNAAGVTLTVTPAGVIGPIQVPVVLPEAGLVVGLMGVPFLAFCVMVGMIYSLRNQGTISSVVKAVGTVGAVAGVVGLCGWQAGIDVPLVGPMLAALSPVSAAQAGVLPADALGKTVGGNGLASARVALLLGAGAALGVYLLVVYALHSHMTKNFDRVMRQLAGAR